MLSEKSNSLLSLFRAVAPYLVLVLIAVQAAEADEASIRAAIEKRESNCCDKDGSTAGMTNCAEKAYAEWDKELNKNYNALMKLLPANGQSALRSSQQTWILFRDKEFKSLDSIYSKLEGTMYIPMSVESRIRVVRDRALQLLADYRLLSEEKDPPASGAGQSKNSKPAK